MASHFLFDPSCKVITAPESSRIEKLAYAHGCSEEKFMEEAGKRVAMRAACWMEERQLPKRVGLLVGKGNNGGDAFVAGCALLDEGYQVVAHVAYDTRKCSPLNQKYGTLFLKKRGKIASDCSDSFREVSLILDGLLGTGFKGELDDTLSQLIAAVHLLKKPILAIDIPSGLDGTTGVSHGGISATLTVALGLVKSGLFLREGWNRVGQLFVENFGLADEYLKAAEPFAYFASIERVRELLPPIRRVRHKYEAGYVIGFAGSKQFQGAPKLSGFAALRAGAGIVRVFHREEIGEIPYELIAEKWTEKKWKEEKKRAKAIFIGPGLGETKEARSWLKKELKTLEIPCVLDADALHEEIVFPKGAILTPHRGEMLRLLGLKKGVEEELFLAKCQMFAKKRGVILVLKGAPTFIFSHDYPPLLVPRGDPGMATAGSGDVLTGIIAAFLAQGVLPFEAAVLGVYLHGMAGEAAAKEKTSYSEIAEDIIASLPLAFQEIVS